VKPWEWWRFGGRDFLGPPIAVGIPERIHPEFIGLQVQGPHAEIHERFQNDLHAHHDFRPIRADPETPDPHQVPKGSST